MTSSHDPKNPQALELVALPRALVVHGGNVHPLRETARALGATLRGDFQEARRILGEGSLGADDLVCRAASWFCASIGAAALLPPYLARLGFVALRALTGGAHEAPPSASMVSACPPPAQKALPEGLAPSFTLAQADKNAPASPAQPIPGPILAPGKKS